MVSVRVYHTGHAGEVPLVSERWNYFTFSVQPKDQGGEVAQHHGIFMIKELLTHCSRKWHLT